MRAARRVWEPITSPNFKSRCAESSSRRCCPLLKYHQKSASRTCSVFRSASFSELVKTRFKSWRLRISEEDLGIAVFDQDVFINAVGGVRIDEPGADLAVLLAIVSSFKNKALPAKHVVFGEVGLAGEVRPVQRGQERLREAAKLGFTHAIVPKANKPKQKIEGLTIISVERVGEAVDYCRT